MASGLPGMHSLDQIDKKILAELQRNARLSHQELSERVGLTATPCARRIRNLEKAGIINGYSANIDEAGVGFAFSVFVSVRLDHQVDDRLLNFEREIGLMPEVVDCWLMTGNRDYLLRIAVADLHEFEQFLTGSLTKVDGVASIESSIPIRRVKQQIARLF
jgi:Lrp/AsnC family leucine-responsive transcriptional regulator